MKIRVWDPSRKVSHLGNVILDRKIITEFTGLISSARIGKPVLMMDIKVSKDKNISRWVDQENLIYVRWNRIKTRLSACKTVSGAYWFTSEFVHVKKQTYALLIIWYGSRNCNKLVFKPLGGKNDLSISVLCIASFL